MGGDSGSGNIRRVVVVTVVGSIGLVSLTIVGSVWQNVLGVLGNCGLLDDLDNLLGGRDGFLDSFLGFNNNFIWNRLNVFKTSAEANVIFLGNFNSSFGGNW